MRYLALACDYDGTLATDGRVDETTLAALGRLLASGRKLILVTGRQLPDLQETFHHLDLFSWVVAENGALLYCPSTREEKLVGPPPSEAFIQLLRAKGVTPLSVGRAIVATWHPHETTVLEAIRAIGLELQVIFNKDAVMILPSGINKATGLALVLDEMGLSPHNVVAVGDAENDHAFMGLCECSTAVANALPMVKQTADWVTHGDHGNGVADLIDALVNSDLVDLENRLARHRILLGTRDSGEEFRLKPYGTRLMIAGPSASGKSTVATAILERLATQKYQFCVIDPEGDYEAFPGALTLGTNQRGPSVEEIVELLAKPDHNVVVNLVGLPVTERPTYFLALLPRLQESRARRGRPHWLVIDETHHVLPASWEPANVLLPQDFAGMMLITVHPDQISPAVLAQIDTAIAVGGSPNETIRQFCQACGQSAPAIDATPLPPGEVLVWARNHLPVARVRVTPGQSEHRRHTRKYALGELPADRSFFFKGPEGRFNLRAQNLFLFLQIADGIDDETWNHHLSQGDYSRWFREMIKDQALADQAEEIEARKNISPRESRALMKKIVEAHYTLPASPNLPMPGTDAR